MSGQPVAKAATYTIHDKHESQTSMPPTGFEPMIPTIKRIEAHTADHMATDQHKLNLFSFLLSLCRAHKHRMNTQVMI